ncbi:hypothetical protein J596_4121, partial [Acinetobacter baumannii 21072]
MSRVLSFKSLCNKALVNDNLPPSRIRAASPVL